MAEATREKPIRAATPADAPAIASILAAAFVDDPVMSWMMGRTNPPPAFFLDLARGVYLTRGFGDLIEGAGATMWLPAGEKAALPFRHELRVAMTLLRHTGAGGVARAKRSGDVLAAHHPPTPHYYLFAVGVSPARKGEGLGGRLIREGLERADAAGAPSYLENSNPRNTPLYQRLGFEPRGELPLPDGAPPLLAMWRDAKGRAS